MSEKVQIRQAEDVLYVQVPYNTAFNQRARRLGGKWDAKERAWAFRVEVERAVRIGCQYYYGTDGTKPTVCCTLHIVLGEGGIDAEIDEVLLGGRRIVSRAGRDQRVVLGTGVSQIEGPDFASSFGSVSSPKVGSNGQRRELLAYDFPRELAKDLIAKKAGLSVYTVAKAYVLEVRSAEEQIAALEAEEAHLRERLEQITLELRALRS